MSLLPLIGLQILFAVPGLARTAVRFARPDLGDPIERAMQSGGLIMILAILAAQWFLAIKMAVVMSKFSYRHVNLLARDWRKRFGTEPPREFTLLEGDYAGFRAWRWSQLFVWYAFKRLVLLPLWWLIATLAFSPIWLAEWLRRRLNPNGQSYIDIIAYTISLVAMARKLLAAW